MSGLNNPPIPDSNHNGVLDGEDLRLQLMLEEKNGSERSPDEKAHGVLELAQLRRFTEVYNKLAIAGKVGNEAFVEAAPILEQQLQLLVMNMNDLAENYSKQEIVDMVGKACKEREMDATSTEMHKADYASAYDFAATFKDTFPKGIALDARDMPELMAHFGALAVPLTNQPKQQEEPKAPFKY